MDPSKVTSKALDDLVYLSKVNHILSLCGVDITVRTRKECTPSMFIVMFEKLLYIHLKDIDRNPSTFADHIQNMEILIRALSKDILRTDLSHINPRDVAELKWESIADMIELFYELCEIIRSQRAFAQQHVAELMDAGGEGCPQVIERQKARIKTSTIAKDYQHLHAENENTRMQDEIANFQAGIDQTRSLAQSVPQDSSEPGDSEQPSDTPVHMPLPAPMPVSAPSRRSSSVPKQSQASVAKSPKPVIKSPSASNKPSKSIASKQSNTVSSQKSKAKPTKINASQKLKKPPAPSSPPSFEELAHRLGQNISSKDTDHEVFDRENQLLSGYSRFLESNRRITDPFVYPVEEQEKVRNLRLSDKDAELRRERHITAKEHAEKRGTRPYMEEDHSFWTSVAAHSESRTAKLGNVFGVDPSSKSPSIRGTHPPLDSRRIPDYSVDSGRKPEPFSFSDSSQDDGKHQKSLESRPVIRDTLKSKEPKTPTASRSQQNYKQHQPQHPHEHLTPEQRNERLYQELVGMHSEYTPLDVSQNRNEEGRGLSRLKEQTLESRTVAWGDQQQSDLLHQTPLKKEQDFRRTRLLREESDHPEFASESTTPSPDEDESHTSPFRKSDHRVTMTEPRRTSQRPIPDDSRRCRSPDLIRQIGELRQQLGLREQEILMAHSSPDRKCITGSGPRHGRSSSAPGNRGSFMSHTHASISKNAFVHEGAHRQRLLYHTIADDIARAKWKQQQQAKLKMKYQLSSAAHAERQLKVHLQQYKEKEMLEARSTELRRRSEQENIYKTMFEQLRKLQKGQLLEEKSRMKEELQQLAKERRVRQEAIDHYYQTQYEMMKELADDTRHERAVAEQANKKAIRSLEREMKEKMQFELERLKEYLKCEEEMHYFRVMDPSRLVESVVQ